MVKKAESNEIETIASLAAMLWNTHSVDELSREFSDLISKDDAQFFLKYENNIPVGFAQCQLRRDYVEGTETSPVGYLAVSYTHLDVYKRQECTSGITAAHSWTLVLSNCRMTAI